MILRPFPTAFAPLFTPRGSILPMIAPQLLSVLLVSGAVVWLHQAAPYYLRDVTRAVHAVRVGVVDVPRAPQQRRLRTLVGGRSQ